MFLEKVISVVSEALPMNLRVETREKLLVSVRSTLEEMDLVTNEELEVQERVLIRTREKLDFLISRIEKLEKGENTPRE